MLCLRFWVEVVICFVLCFLMCEMLCCVCRSIPCCVALRFQVYAFMLCVFVLVFSGVRSICVMCSGVSLVALRFKVE